MKILENLLINENFYKIKIVFGKQEKFFFFFSWFIAKNKINKKTKKETKKIRKKKNGKNMK